MDKGRRVQANELVTGITVHRACRGIGRDHAAGLHIVDDQRVAGSLKNALIGSFFAHMDCLVVRVSAIAGRPWISPNV